MLLQALALIHHITTMLFGIFLSAFFLGAKQDRKNILLLLSTGAVSGLLYYPVVLALGTSWADPIYPLLVHLPLFLLLVFYYKYRWLPALVSILTAYLCCQFSNWAGILAFSICSLDWVYYLTRILTTCTVFSLLSRHLCQTTALLLSKSDRDLYILGAMPLVYYLFDYVTTKFSTLLYSGSKVVVEFLAFSMCLSYVIFLLVYFQEYELKNRAEQYGQLTAMQLSSLRSEIEQARISERHLRILRHDTRHHLSAIESLIRQQHPEKALDYIREINQHYDDTILHSFCSNELLNSVLSIYSARFAEQDITFDAEIEAPEKLPCSEMTFCAILSNVLENAMHAVQKQSGQDRRVYLSIFERSGHLLMLEKNPTDTPPVFSDGIPVTAREGHGIGVQSVIYYVEQEHGQYQFYLDGRDFTVRILL
ncbi:GHKL domain-containing protein [Faecalicatena orotica]|nr:GHKL domain-containing protein [Faecalicatena orotica]